MFHVRVRPSAGLRGVDNFSGPLVTSRIPHKTGADERGLVATGDATTPRTKLAARVALAACGLLAGLPFLWAGWQHRKPASTWHAHVALENLDCSHPEICRLKPSTQLTQHYGGGGTFEVRSNALGFRGPDRNETRVDARTLRIQLYGDSFTYGIGADEGRTLADALETTLRERHPTRAVEVMNFGLPANFLPSNLVAYRDFGRRFTPDLVVFCQNRLGGLRANDVNARVREIRSSRLLSSMMGWGAGRYLVNAWQTANVDRMDDDALAREYTQLWGPVIEDHKGLGMQVAAFSFVDEPGVPSDIFPSTLSITRIASDVSDAQYQAGPYVLVGDGHPSREGVRHFAGRIADAVERMHLYAEGE